MAQQLLVAGGAEGVAALGIQARPMETRAAELGLHAPAYIPGLYLDTGSEAGGATILLPQIKSAWGDFGDIWM